MNPEWFPNWSGETCVIVASGPSAGTIDLSLARGKARFIAINESWRLAPWSDVLYGCDDAFWKQKQGVPEFTGLRISQDASACARYSDNPRLKVHRVVCDKHTDSLILDRLGTVGWGGNSGFQAINLAVQFGVRKIVLVGYDMRLDRGMHWHGKHPPSMNNPIDRNVERWCRAVDATVPVLRGLGIEAINCSLVSSLKAFQKMSFDKMFPGTPEAAIPEPHLRIKETKPRVLAIANPLSGPEGVTCFGDAYSYFILREMAKRADVAIYPYAAAITGCEGIPLEEFDHVIGFGLRFWNKFYSVGKDGEEPLPILKQIRSRIKGIMAQMAELPPPHSVADVSFTSRGPTSKMTAVRPHPPYHVIGWAADHELCSPRQKPGPLRILFDHPAYNYKSAAAKRALDYTPDFIRQANELRSSPLLSKHGFTGVEIDILTTPKAGDVAVPFTDIAGKFSRSHVYINGHIESVGLSVIEAATAGCLVVTPKDYIHDELLVTVRRSVVNNGKIDWDYVLRKVDPAASRAKATQQSWSLACEKMLAYLASHRR